MAIDNDGYFINDTGKTLQEVIDSFKSGSEPQGILNSFLNLAGTPAEKREFNLMTEGRLRDEDLVEINPDEMVLCFDKVTSLTEPPANHALRRLGDLIEFPNNLNSEADEDNTDAIKFHDSFFGKIKKPLD